MRIPFCPLSVNRAKVVAKKFYWLTEPLVKMSPSLKLQLEQSRFNLDEREYLSIAIFSAFFIFSVTFFPLLIISLSYVSLLRGISLSMIISLVLFFVTIFYIRMYPKLIIKKRVADIEKNLVYSLRHVYVHIKAGVPMFDALVAVSGGKYGAVSEEFRKVVKDINTGTRPETALEDLALKNPSLYFRRAIWQISNGIKAGGDVSKVLRGIVDNISAEQKIAIRRYGSQLNPLTLVYMMIAVIIPSLGITFLMILSTFSGITISETMFWIILLLVALLQFMFLGIIKSRRPNLL